MELLGSNGLGRAASYLLGGFISLGVAMDLSDSTESGRTGLVGSSTLGQAALCLTGCFVSVGFVRW